MSIVGRQSSNQTLRCKPSTFAREFNLAIRLVSAEVDCFVLGARKMV